MYSRKCLYVFLCLFVLLSVNNSFAQNPQRELRIEFPKDTFLLFEPIWVDVSIVNISSLPAQFHFTFEFDLRDSSGTQFEYKSSQKPEINRGNLQIEPGEEYLYSFNIFDWFYSEEAPKNYPQLGWHFLHFLPGTYSIKIKFEGDESNILYFTVVEPTGAEKEALDIIVEAHDYWLHDDLDPMPNIAFLFLY